jgi:DNA-directed RNA polymerase subunit RPC12/RpoP
MTNNQDEFIRLDCPRCGAPLLMEGDQLTCQYCGARLILKRSAARREHPAQNAQQAGETVSGISLRPFAYFDPQSGLEAFSILVPQDWQVNGGITWVPERPAAPVSSALQMVNPNGLEAFEAFPILYFTWSNNPMIQMTNPTGSLYFGYEVRQPMPARNAMRQLVLPRYRKFRDLSIIDEGPANELEQIALRSQVNTGQGGQYSTDSVRMRLHYTFNQQPAAEEISSVAEYVRIVIPGLFGHMENVYWTMGYLTSFRAERTHLDNYIDLYRTIFATIKINPASTAVVQQVSQGLTGNTIHSINQIGALSRQISRNYNEISDMNLRGWQERSAAYDRISENFSQTIRGVDPYFDPNTGQNIELPSGYTQAWSTPLGEYLLSDDPKFNPNIGSNQNWTPLTPPIQE